VLTAAVLLAVLLGSLAQSVSGIGFALVCGPLLVAALGPADGVRLSVALSLALNVVLLVRLWRRVDRRRTLLLLLPAALATPLLAVAVRSLPARPAAGLAGAVVLLGVALLTRGARWPGADGTAGTVGAGVLGATTNLVAGIAGPVVAVWAVATPWRADVQRASLQAYFLGLNCVALPSLGLPSVGAPLALACVVALGAGALLGAPLARRVSEAAARRTTLGLAAVGGCVVLVQALLG